MNPLIFAPAGMPANNQKVVRAPVSHGGNYHPAVLQVVSADSQTENGGATTQMAMVSIGNVVALQKPKKWVRWSDHKDQVLRRTVEQF